MQDSIRHVCGTRSYTIVLLNNIVWDMIPQHRLTIEDFAWYARKDVELYFCTVSHYLLHLPGLLHLLLPMLLHPLPLHPLPSRPTCAAASMG